jgi:hypothetical protein
VDWKRWDGQSTLISFEQLLSVLFSSRRIMKIRFLGTLVAGTFLALMIAAPARAQMPGTAMRVTVPFEFIVSGKTLPAGNYEIRRINDTPEGLVIRNVIDKHDHMMFETEAVEAKKIPRRSEVIFHRYGDTYFLSEIFSGGEQMGRELRTSRAERRMKYEAARNEIKQETVALAAD